MAPPNTLSLLLKWFPWGQEWAPEISILTPQIGLVVMVLGIHLDYWSKGRLKILGQQKRSEKVRLFETWDLHVVTTQGKQRHTHGAYVKSNLFSPWTTRTKRQMWNPDSVVPTSTLFLPLLFINRSKKPLEWKHFMKAALQSTFKSCTLLRRH